MDVVCQLLGAGVALTGFLGAISLLIAWVIWDFNDSNEKKIARAKRLGFGSLVACASAFLLFYILPCTLG